MQKGKTFRWTDMAFTSYIQLKELQQTIRLNANNRMVDITKVLPGIVLDLKYAGTDNFMKQKLYPSIQTTYLHAPAAALQK